MKTETESSVDNAAAQGQMQGVAAVAAGFGKPTLAKLKGCSGVLTTSVTVNNGTVHRKGTHVKVASVWRGKLSVQVERTGAWIFQLTPSGFLANIPTQPRET